MSSTIDRSLAAAGLPPLQRSAWVEVDVDQLVTNAHALAALARPAALGPVVKADGYGHGLEMAARCAVVGGATWLCVADAAEAGRLRADGYRGRALVLYPVPEPMVEEMARLEVDVTVGDVDIAGSLSGDARPGPPVRAHLEIDTGMTRGGVAAADVVAAARALATGDSVELAGVWTHLAAPEAADVTAAQMATFRSSLEAIRSAGMTVPVAHASASGGLLAASGQFDLTRPGLAYYGLHPGAGGPLPESVAPALSVRATPVRITHVPAGTAVGYAGTWVSDRPSTIVTLPIGYADGWSRSSSPGTFAIVVGRRAPVVGRVSSDSLTVDVTDLGGQVDMGSVFTLLGRDGDETVDADEVAAVRETISWEVLQQLGARLSRVYTAGGSPVALRPEGSVELRAASEAELPGYRDRPLSPTGPRA